MAIRRVYEKGALFLYFGLTLLMSDSPANGDIHRQKLYHRSMHRNYTEMVEKVRQNIQ